MTLRLRIALLVVIATVSVAAIAVVRETPRSPSSSSDPGRSLVPIATVVPPTLADAVTYRDQLFDPKVVPSPTASKAQSKLWYAHGSWWGLLHEPTSDELHIHQLGADGSTWIDTGTLVDERPLARGDALAVDDQLWIVTAGRRQRAADAIQLARFTFRDGVYRLDPDFPISLSDTGVETVVLARDGADRLWIAYASARHVRVRASEGDDHHWGTTFTPAVDGTVVSEDDIAAVVPFGESVGLMWSNQIDDTVYFSVHRDDDPVDAWSPAEVVSRGERQPDDHINMKADEDGRVYAALKTSLETLPNANRLAPQIILAVRDPQGTWHEHLVSRVKDRHTRPIVLIDEEHREVYVVATSPAAGGSIYYKRSPLDDILFETGVGTPLVESEDDLRISNATSTKQSLTFESGLVVLASDNTTARYLHGVLEIGGLGSGAVPPPLPGGEPAVVVNDAFDSWKDGEPLPASWVGRDVDPGGATVQARGERGRVGVLLAVDDGPPPRICRGFVPITAGHALITFDARVRGTGRTEAVLALVRGEGGDAAQLRFGSRGTFGYFAGTQRVVSAARWTGDTWYRVTLDLDVATRSTTLSITDEAGDAVLRQTRVAWPDRATSVDEICFQAAAGAARPSLEFDSLLVARSVPVD